MQRRPVEIAVISDVHLGTYGCHAKELLAYLQSISPQILTLNGNIIDGWQFSKRYFPASHMAVIKEIFNFLSGGTRVIYITCNHDEMLRRFSGPALGNFIQADKYLLEINGKTIWAFHGDVFDNTTRKTAKILARIGGDSNDLLIQFNRLVNFISKTFGSEKLSFSKRIKNIVKKVVTYINNFENTIASIAVEKKYDYVICGYIHQPEIRNIESPGGKVTEAAPAGVTSYVYNGDLNNDGNSANDLIYIPANKTDINLVKSGSGGLGTGTSTDPRTAAQIYAQLDNFINQDSYLSKHRGQVASANAVVLPFFKKADLNITEDNSVKAGKERHTVKVSLDILNVGNLLNRNWGLIKTPVLTNFLRYEGLAADGKTPSYSFTYQDATNQVPVQTSFSNSTGIGSRWQMQLGLRYLFN